MHLILTWEPGIQRIELLITILRLQYVIQGEVRTAVAASEQTSLPPHQTQAMKPVGIDDASGFDHIASRIHLMDHRFGDGLKYAGHCAWTSWKQEGNFGLGDLSAGF